MERHIKSIWNVFKSLKKEAFYLFYEENSVLKSCKISKNETENSGEIDVEELLSVASVLAHKKVWAIHNHPTDLPTPSFPDLFQAHYVQSLLALCNIEMADYGIVSPYGYTSFLANGEMKAFPDFSAYHPSSVEEPNLPLLFLSKDILKEEQLFLDTLKKTPEIILTNKVKYASNCFPGEFILSKRRDLASKNILFYGKDFHENKKRLRELDVVLEPFEIYGIVNNRLIPLKLHGFL